MSRRLIVRIAPLLLVMAAARPARADEAPTPAAPPAVPPAAAPAAPGLPPAPKAPAPLPAAEAGPEAAWRALQERMGDPSQRRGSALSDAATAWLGSWQALGRTPTATEQYWLGLMLQAARRSPESLSAFAAASGGKDVEPGLRVQALTLWAGMLRSLAREGALPSTEAEVALLQLQERLPLAKDAQPATRAALLMARAALEARLGSTAQAIASLVAAAGLEASQAVPVAQDVVRMLLESCERLEQVPPAREAAAKALASLGVAQEAAVTRAREAVATAGEGRGKAGAQRALAAALAGLEAIRNARRPLDLLGETAAEWTLVRAYGKGKQLADWRGKVVVLDFWATWCPWCIRSFPALRDLLRDYAGQDLAVVGVTASGASVFEQRYDLDDDLKAKAGGNPAPVAKRPAKPPEPGAGAPEEERTSYPARLAAYEEALAMFKGREQEAIAAFIANHGLAWDVVLVDEGDPAPKYALRGWPHCVVLDRQGRIRHFKAGALLRDKPEGVAALRAVIDRLLAEPR